MKQPCCLKKHNPTYAQIHSNELCEVNPLFVMSVKQIVIIIVYAATNRGWHLTLNVYWWSFKSLNWIVHIILLILGETWSKGSNLMSLLLVDVFAEVAKVNAEALNIKSKMYFHIVTSAVYLLSQKLLKFESWIWETKH